MPAADADVATTGRGATPNSQPVHPPLPSRKPLLGNPFSALSSRRRPSTSPTRGPMRRAALRDPVPAPSPPPHSSNSPQMAHSRPPHTQLHLAPRGETLFALARGPVYCAHAGTGQHPLTCLGGRSGLRAARAGRSSSLGRAVRTRRCGIPRSLLVWRLPRHFDTVVWRHDPSRRQSRRGPPALYDPRLHRPPPLSHVGPHCSGPRARRWRWRSTPIARGGSRSATGCAQT